MEKREYPKTTAELKVGTVLFERWKNFVFFYKILKTTTKEVVIQQLNFKILMKTEGDLTCRFAIPSEEFWPDSTPKRKRIYSNEDFNLLSPNGKLLQIYKCPQVV